MKLCVTSAFRRGASSAAMMIQHQSLVCGDCHQCLSAWSFFSCLEKSRKWRFGSLRHQCLSAWSFFSCAAVNLLCGSRKVRSPVPFGVELLQLGRTSGRRISARAPVTSAFRRGASSAAYVRVTNPIKSITVTSAFRRGASSAAGKGSWGA